MAFAVVGWCAAEALAPHVPRRGVVKTFAHGATGGQRRSMEGCCDPSAHVESERRKGRREGRGAKRDATMLYSEYVLCFLRSTGVSPPIYPAPVLDKSLLWATFSSFFN